MPGELGVCILPGRADEKVNGSVDLLEVMHGPSPVAVHVGGAQQNQIAHGSKTVPGRERLGARCVADERGDRGL